MAKVLRSRAALDQRDAGVRRGNRLTEWDRLFITEYMRDWSCAEAGIRMGMTGPRRAIHSAMLTSLRQPAVRAEINRRLEARQKTAEISEQRVLAEIARIAFSNPLASARVFDDDGRARFDIALLTESDMAGISSVKQRKDGSIEIKVHDKLDALEKLGRRLKLFNDPSDKTPVGVVRFIIEDSPRKVGDGSTRRIAAEVTIGQASPQPQDTRVIEHVIDGEGTG